MTDAVKGLLEAMNEMGTDAWKCMSLLQNAFIYNSADPLKGCSVQVEAIKKMEPELTAKIVALAKDNPELKPYVSVPAQLLRIGEGIEKLAKAIGKKNKDGILFSDRAVTETIFLLQRLSEILKPAIDMILTRNKFLNRYIQESEANIAKDANEYATLHEERLIAGECFPVASSIYVSMLDAIKNVAWHSKEISAKLAG